MLQPIAACTRVQTLTRPCPLPVSNPAGFWSLHSQGAGHGKQNFENFSRGLPMQYRDGDVHVFNRDEDILVKTK